MARNKTLLFLVVLCCFALSSCNLHKKTGGGGGGGGNIGAIAVTMVANTLPVNPSLFSFRVTIASIKFTTSSGTSTTVNLNPALSVDLMRLQSDTVFLGTFGSMPVAQYTSVTLVISGNANITFLNDTGATLSGCASNNVCPVSLAASSNPVATVSYSVVQNLVTGIGIDLNFANAVSISAGSLVVNFSNTNVLSGFTLPRANSNLASGQLDLIEDFTGVVSISGSNATITSATRGTLTANTSNSFVDPSPDGSICSTASSFASCAVAGQIVSVDAFLDTNGTISLKEFEPLNATQQDFIEGVVDVSPTNPTQFTIVTTDIIKAATNSVISTLNIGDIVTVNIPALTQGFLVDSKGLALTTFSSYNDFFGQTTTSAIFPGQTVALHLTAFTAANGTTLAVATADTVVLRWTRLRANVVSTTSASININTLPSYFVLPASSQEVVQAFFNGALGTDGVTNLDGVVNNASGLTTGQAVGLRVLYFQNSANTANPAFFAAKIRQP